MHRSVPQLTARRTAPTSSLPKTRAEQALEEVILAAYPTALLTFFHEPSATRSGSGGDASRRTGKTSSNRVEDVLRSVNAVQPSSIALAGSITPRSFLDTQLSVEDSLWEYLHRFCLPRKITVPGCYPRCRFFRHATCPGKGDRPLPCWAPHAVVNIGGFDGNDLRIKVLPTLLPLLPALSEDMQVTLPDAEHVRVATAKRIETVRDRRRMPAYVEKRFLERNAFYQKGCMALGSSTLELSLPSGVGDERERVFAAFAGTGATVAELLRERQPTRRALLRSAFGVTLPLLQQALPAPVSFAVMAIRDATERSADSRLAASSAFWVSAVAHYVARTSWGQFISASDIRDDVTEGMRQEMTRLADGVEFDGCCHSRIDTQDGLQPSLATQCALAGTLARRVLAWVAAGTEEEWSTVLLRNYFLPVEDFTECEDIKHLSEHRTLLTRVVQSLEPEEPLQRRCVTLHQRLTAHPSFR